MPSPYKSQAADATCWDQLIYSPNFAFILEGNWTLKNCFALYILSSQKKKKTPHWIYNEVRFWTQVFRIIFCSLYHLELWKSHFYMDKQKHNSFSLWAMPTWCSQFSLLCCKPCDICFLLFLKPWSWNHAIMWEHQLSLKTKNLLLAFVLVEESPSPKNLKHLQSLEDKQKRDPDLLFIF